MPELKVTVQIELDGQPLGGSSPFFIARQNVTEALPFNDLQAAPDNNSTAFHQLAAAIMGTLQVLALQTDETINVRLNGSTTAFQISGNGLLLIVGGSIAAGASTNVTVNNPAATGAANANLSGVAAGT